ncbi:MAG: hypothetical protein JWO98_4520 [Frankiales bacterium]|nr:hypothetical protein [Frankiales bacterium]
MIHRSGDRIPVEVGIGCPLCGNIGRHSLDEVGRRPTVNDLGLLRRR